MTDEEKELQALLTEAEQTLLAAIKAKRAAAFDFAATAFLHTMMPATWALFLAWSVGAPLHAVAVAYAQMFVGAGAANIYFYLKHR